MLPAQGFPILYGQTSDSGEPDHYAGTESTFSPVLSQATAFLQNVFPCTRGQEVGESQPTESFGVIKERAQVTHMSEPPNPNFSLLPF